MKCLFFFLLVNYFREIGGYDNEKTVIDRVAILPNKQIHGVIYT